MKKVIQNCQYEEIKIDNKGNVKIRINVNGMITELLIKTKEIEKTISSL